MTKNQIQQFIDERPAISVSALCREVGISKRYLDYILDDERSLTDETVRKLIPVMEKYGYKKT